MLVDQGGPTALLASTTPHSLPVYCDERWSRTKCTDRPCRRPSCQAAAGAALDAARCWRAGKPCGLGQRRAGRAAGVRAHPRDGQQLARVRAAVPPAARALPPPPPSLLPSADQKEAAASLHG